MKGSRYIVMAGSVALLAASTLAAPVGAATKADVAIVNGIPNKKVDVCINKNEIKSGLKYGGKVFKKISGTKKLTFRVKSPGKCKGAVLAKKIRTFGGGDDLTIVGTKKSPNKVLVFDNTLLGPLPALLDTTTAWRHAADLKDVGFNIGYAPIDIDAWEHAGDAFWDKGDELIDGAFNDSQTHIMSMSAVVPFSEFFYAHKTTIVYPGQRYEWIFLGSNGNNAKITTIVRQLDV